MRCRIEPVDIVIARALAPVFFVLGLGYLAGRRKLVDNQNISALTVTLMNFALPASLFAALARTPRDILFQQDRLVLALGLALTVVYGITWCIERYWLRLTASVSAIQSLTVAFPNFVAVGLPLMQSVFGIESLVPVAAGIAVGAIVISPVTLVILEGGTEKAQRMSTTKRLFYAVLQSCKKPVMWAPFAGFVVSVLGLQLPDLAGRMLSLIGQSTAGLALFLTGLILSAQPFRMDKNVLLGVLLKNCFQPALMFVIVASLGISGTMGREAVVLCALPVGFFGTVFGARYGVASIEASSTLIASTFFAIITLSLLILLTPAM
jgi:malonate transporter